MMTIDIYLMLKIYIACNLQNKKSKESENSRILTFYERIK